MFSEFVYPPSRKPVTSCRDDLIAVCWTHTNQGIDMCTLSLCPGNGQSLCKSGNASLFATVKLHNILFNCIEMPQTSQTFLCSPVDSSAICMMNSLTAASSSLTYIQSLRFILIFHSDTHQLLCEREGILFTKLTRGTRLSDHKRRSTLVSRITLRWSLRGHVLHLLYSDFCPCCELCKKYHCTRGSAPGEQMCMEKLYHLIIYNLE